MDPVIEHAREAARKLRRRMGWQFGALLAFCLLGTPILLVEPAGNGDATA